MTIIVCGCRSSKPKQGAAAETALCLDTLKSILLPIVILTAPLRGKARAKMIPYPITPRNRTDKMYGIFDSQSICRNVSLYTPNVVALRRSCDGR
jgi:hypothetical protein